MLPFQLLTAHSSNYTSGQKTLKHLQYSPEKKGILKEKDSIPTSEPLRFKGFAIDFN